MRQNDYANNLLFVEKRKEGEMKAQIVMEFEAQTLLVSICQNSLWIFNFICYVDAITLLFLLKIIKKKLQCYASQHKR